MLLALGFVLLVPELYCRSSLFRAQVFKPECRGVNQGFESEFRAFCLEVLDSSQKRLASNFTEAPSTYYFL